MNPCPYEIIHKAYQSVLITKSQWITDEVWERICELVRDEEELMLIKRVFDRESE